MSAKSETKWEELPEDERRLLIALREDFLARIGDSLDSCESDLMQFETSGSKEKIVEIKRQLHSIKGSAGAVDLHDLAKVIHVLEGCLESGAARDPVEFVSKILSILDGLREYAARSREGRVATDVLARLESKIAA